MQLDSLGALQVRLQVQLDSPGLPNYQAQLHLQVQLDSLWALQMHLQVQLDSPGTPIYQAQ